MKFLIDYTFLPTVLSESMVVLYIMKGTKVQTLGGRAVAGAWLVAWAIMAMGAIIKRMRTAN